MEKLLTLKEVSEILGYTKDKKYRFVRELRKRGEIPAVKIGNRLLFKEQDVKDYIDYQFKKQNF